MMTGYLNILNMTFLNYSECTENTKVKIGCQCSWFVFECSLNCFSKHFQPISIWRNRFDARKQCFENVWTRFKKVDRPKTAHIISRPEGDDEFPCGLEFKKIIYFWKLVVEKKLKKWFLDPSNFWAEDMLKLLLSGWGLQLSMELLQVFWLST